jgi:hypothetical protein
MDVLPTSSFLYCDHIVAEITSCYHILQAAPRLANVWRLAPKLPYRRVVRAGMLPAARLSWEPALTQVPLQEAPQQQFTQTNQMHSELILYGQRSSLRWTPPPAIEFSAAVHTGIVTAAAVQHQHRLRKENVRPSAKVRQYRDFGTERSEEPGCGNRMPPRLFLQQSPLPSP